MKDYSKAFSHFQEAIKINPKYLYSWVSLARTQIYMNDLIGAERTTRFALDHWPSNPSLNFNLSLIMLKKGAYQEAIKIASRVMVRHPESTDVLKVLAESYRMKGQYEKAIHLWEQFSSANNNNLESQLALIDLYSKTGQTIKIDAAIGKVMLIKGSKSWKNLIKEYNKDMASHAFKPDPLLVPIILSHLKNQQ